ncbi:Crp/Fnr family transcriptional regulator [Chitinophaga lutea]
MSQTPVTPFDVLFGALESFGTKVPEETKQAIMGKCVINEYKKGDIILNYGQTCRDVSFILDGVAASKFRMYNDERISWVMLQYDVFISILSFYKEVPSEEKIEAMEDTTCICLSKKDLDEITDNCISFKDVRLKLTEHYYALLFQQLYMMHLQKKEREIYLRKIRPELFQFTCGIEIAQFLGVSQSTQYRKK